MLDKGMLAHIGFVANASKLDLDDPEMLDERTYAEFMFDYYVCTMDTKVLFRSAA